MQCYHAMMSESLLHSRQIRNPFSHQNSPFLTSRVTKPHKRKRKDKKEKINTPNSLNFHCETSIDHFKSDDDLGTSVPVENFSSTDEVSSDQTKCRLQRKPAPLETINFGPLLDTIETLIAKLLYNSSIGICYSAILSLSRCSLFLLPAIE